MTLIDKIREWKNRREEEMLQNQMDDNEQPRQIRDKYLESLERERQFQMNQDRKELLKKQIANYKKQKMKELLYGIKDKKEKRDSYLGDHVINRQVNVLNDSNNLLRQKNMMTGSSLLNNKVDEFRRFKRKKLL